MKRALSCCNSEIIVTSLFANTIYYYQPQIQSTQCFSWCVLVFQYTCSLPSGQRCFYMIEYYAVVVFTAIWLYVGPIKLLRSFYSPETRGRKMATCGFNPHVGRPVLLTQTSHGGGVIYPQAYLSFPMRWKHNFNGYPWHPLLSTTAIPMELTGVLPHVTESGKSKMVTHKRPSI